VFFGYSIRIHHWLGGEAQEPSAHFHNHPHDFISFLFKGSYTNHTPSGSRFIKAPFLWWSKADAYHHLEVPATGAWTILLCGRPYVKWGFDVNGHHWRPLRYFHKFGD
jgi:hypothetical protein